MSYTQIKLLSGHTTLRLCFPTHPATGVIPRSPMGIDLANQFTARKAIEVEARIQPLNQKKLLSRFIVFYSLNEMIIDSSSFVLSFVILDTYPPWNWQLVHEHRPSQKELSSSNHPFSGAKMWVSGSRVSTKDPGDSRPNLRRNQPIGFWATHTRGLGNVCKGTSDHHVDVSESSGFSPQNHPF